MEAKLALWRKNKGKAENAKVGKENETGTAAAATAAATTAAPKPGRHFSNGQPQRRSFLAQAKQNDSRTGSLLSRRSLPCNSALNGAAYDEKQASMQQQPGVVARQSISCASAGGSARKRAMHSDVTSLTDDDSTQPATIENKRQKAEHTSDDNDDNDESSEHNMMNNTRQSSSIQHESAEAQPTEPMLNDGAASTAADTHNDEKNVKHCITEATNGNDDTAAADEHSMVVDGSVHDNDKHITTALSLNATAAVADVVHEATTVAQHMNADAFAVSKKSDGAATHTTEPHCNTNAGTDTMDFTFNEDLFSYDGDTTISHHTASGRRSDRRRLTITSASIEHNDNGGTCVEQQTDDNDTILQHTDMDDTASDGSFGLNGCGISSQSSSSSGSSSQPDTSFKTAMYDTIAQQQQLSTTAVAVAVTANTVIARSPRLSVSTETAAVLDANKQNGNGGTTVSKLTDDDTDDVTAPDVDMLTYRRGSLFGTSNDDSNSNSSSNSSSSRIGTPTGMKIDIPKYNNSGNNSHQSTGTSIARFNSTAVMHHNSISHGDSAAIAAATSTSDACIQAGNGKMLNDADYAELYTKQELQVIQFI
jgi:hypothetical protein